MPTLPSDPAPFWVAHDSPERPFTYGMWLCSCDACRIALAAEAAVRPQTQLVIKSAMDRKVVSAAELCEVMLRHGSAAALLEDTDDYVREIFVGRLDDPANAQAA